MSRLVIKMVAQFDHELSIESTTLQDIILKF